MTTEIESAIGNLAQAIARATGNHAASTDVAQQIDRLVRSRAIGETSETVRSIIVQEIADRVPPALRALGLCLSSEVPEVTSVMGAPYNERAAVRRILRARPEESIEDAARRLTRALEDVHARAHDLIAVSKVGE